MKILGALATFILFLCVTVAAPAYAQDRDESRPGQPQEEKAKDKDKDKDKDKHDDKAAKPGEPRQQPGMNQEERREQPEAARPQEEKRPQEERKEQKPEERMERGNQQHPAHAQQGKRIPDDKFRASFGRQHTFHVQRTQIINNPQPVVVYGGYSFQLIDPWPAEWAFDDDCYIDYVDGEYFLFDAFHPGIRIAVFVVG